MLLDFTFSNYKAFSHSQTLDLSAANGYTDKETHLLDLKLAGLSKKKWLKGCVLYGANASGKSSVLDAFRAVTNLVIESAKETDPKEKIKSVEHFVFDTKETATIFKVNIAVESIRYEFTVVAKQERILHESLRAFPSSTGKEQLWYSRDWDSETNEYLWGPERNKFYKASKEVKRMTLQNVLFLSRAVSLGDMQLEPVYRWFKDNVIFIDLCSDKLDDKFTSDSIKDPHVRELITNLLKAADVGVSDIKVKKANLSSKIESRILDKLPSDRAEEIILNLKNHQFVNLEHTGPEGATAYLPWSAESSGTQRLYSLLGPWIDILNNDHVVFIDELDTSMHTFVVTELLKLFYKNDFSNAQLIFTTHNAALLDRDIFRRDQIWFSEKNRSGEAHIYPLTKFNPRNDESIVKGYLSGRYGGTPYIPEGLFSGILGKEIVK